MQGQTVGAKNYTIRFENEKEGKFLPLLMNYGTLSTLKATYYTMLFLRLL